MQVFAAVTSYATQASVQQHQKQRAKAQVLENALFDCCA
jgi:hypothetical protein